MGKTLNGVVCFAPQGHCLGCAHYEGKAHRCIYAPAIEIPASACRQMILDAVDLKDGAISARDAEIARLREALSIISNDDGREIETTHETLRRLQAVARSALEASHDEKPEGK